MSATATYTLADGREVDESCPLARWERELLAKHIADLRRQDSAGRRLYLEDVGRSMGQAYRQKLADAYAADWQARKDAATKETRHA